MASIEIKIIVDGQEYEFVPKVQEVVAPEAIVTETTPEAQIDTPVETSPAV